MKRGQSFSDERVRHLKGLMMRGADPIALAILEGVSANTMWRMKRGETYNHVKVEGEEGMRAAVLYVEGYDPSKAGETALRERKVFVPEITDEEVEASIMRLQQPMEEKLKVSKEVADAAKAFGVE